MKVQGKLKNYINGMRGRKEFLRKMWDKEHYNMVINLSKGKTKTKKQKDYIAKIRAIPDTIKEAMLTRYMDKQKHHNAIEFFNWRRKL